MSEDQWAADHEIADAAVLVIVDIGSANSDRQNPDQDLAFRWSWNWTLLNSQVARRVQDRRGHGALRPTRIAGRPGRGHGGLLAGAHRSSPEVLGGLRLYLLSPKVLWQREAPRAASWLRRP